MFRICVSSWAFVSGMGFDVWFRHLSSWIWVCWVSAFGYGFRPLVVADFVAVGLFCGGCGFVGNAVLVPWWWLCYIFFFLL